VICRRRNRNHFGNLTVAKWFDVSCGKKVMDRFRNPEAGIVPAGRTKAPETRDRSGVAEIPFPVEQHVRKEFPDSALKMNSGELANGS
jgi:hypothetical protein